MNCEARAPSLNLLEIFLQPDGARLNTPDNILKMFEAIVNEVIFIEKSMDNTA